jgi:hypothetical protein
LYWRSAQVNLKYAKMKMPIIRNSFASRIALVVCFANGKSCVKLMSWSSVPATAIRPAMM